VPVLWQHAAQKAGSFLAGKKGARVGTLLVSIKRLFYPLAVVLSRWNAAFGTSDGLHKARFSLDHEVAGLTTDRLPTDSLLIGVNHFSRVLHVRATPKRRELGNMLIQAPTGGGKGLLAVCQLLTWGGSAVVFDIKGDLYKQTAGYRKTLGPVYRFDTRGYGHCYDPLRGKQSEDELYALAKQLMYEPNEADGKAFTQRGTKMLTIVFLAGQEDNRNAGKADAPLLPFVGHMADLGLNRAARLIHAISPDLARRFLDEDYNPDKDYTENKYLANSWESATARLYPLLTERILRCFNGSDFTAADIIGGRKPVTVYLCIPEKDLSAKAPVLRLVMESLLAEMKEYFDDAPGETAAEKGCRQVLYLMDEAGTVGLPSLPNDVATVRSRGISIWAAYQDNAQMESLYGRYKAKAIRNNMDAKLFYRQSDFETAKDIAESLGYRSAYAHTHTLRDGQAASEGLSEQAVAVLTARDISELDPQNVIALFSNYKPIWLKRMDWQGHPILRQRRAMPPPPVTPLPPLATPSDKHETDTANTLWQRERKLPNGYVDPDKRY
jgi:type IV secretion system protein VirD4